MPNMDAKTHEFLTHYIFCPVNVWLPESYEESILKLNIWPKGMLLEQKKALIARDTFTLGKTTFHTRQPKLIFEGRGGSFTEVPDVE